MSTLRLAEVSVRRAGAIVLDVPTLAFGAGRLTAVIGPNGAGKSTLLGVAAGLLRPVAGTVSLGSADLGRLGRAELARRRAFLPQGATVDWPISVERVVALGLTPSLPPFGGLPARLAPLVERALAECGLTALRARPATQLSGGERARVLLARAIVGDPALLIVDEPTAGLDPRHAIDAVRRLRARADRGRTVIMAIHDLALALRFADEVVALREGRIAFAGVAGTTMTEERLGALFDVGVRIVRDGEGASIRFVG